MEASQSGLVEGVSLRDPARWWGVGEVVRLSIPSVLNTVTFTIMQFVDGWMVSKVGTEAMSAQFVGAISAFTPVCFFIGLLSCVSTFASQNLGAGRPERSALYGWQGLWIALAAAVLLAALIPFGPALMALFHHGATVTALEAQYLRILLAGAAFTLASAAVGSYFMGMHRPGVPLIAGLAGNVVNFFAALVLIFGLVGLPRLGLVGAGIGSLCGAAAQAAVLLGVFTVGPLARKYQTRARCVFSWAAMAELLRIGWPAGAMFAGDVLMWTIFMCGIVGGFGLADLAACTILNRYWHLCFMPAIGVAVAATAIVGKYCGARRTDLAWRRAHAALLLVEGYMVTCGVLMWLFRDRLVDVFNPKQDPLVQALAVECFVFILVCQAFDALNVVFIGALRGAGDTLVPGIVQLVLAYGLGIGGAAVVAHVRPDWGSLGPWTVGSIYIAILGVLMWMRFLGGKWRRMSVVDRAAAPVEG